MPNSSLHGARPNANRWSSSHLRLAAAACAASLVVGCGAGRHLSDRDRATGTIALTLIGGEGLAGFQFDVSTPDSVVVASRFVAGTAAATTAEALFVVPAGSYLVKATPMKTATVPEPSCVSAVAPAEVRKGQTMEIVLIARCQGRPGGGIAVTAGTNSAPDITSVLLDPSSRIAPCQPLAITATASDADQDPLTFKFTGSGGVPSTMGAPFSVTRDPQGPGNVARFMAAAAGAFEITVQACDAGGCTPLAFPVHVAGPAGTCTLACDDRNPCTNDSQNSDGTCVQAVLPDGPRCTGGKLRVKLLGFNDFHGQLDPRVVAGRPAGGAAVLASYLQSAQAGVEAQTIIVHAGDHVGASPPDSALFQDEPAIQVVNMLANNACSYTNKLDPACNVVGTLGNHEFDEGKGELLRLLGGGNFATGPFFEDPYRGARYPNVSANVTDEISGQPILPPYVIKRVHGIPVAFIGAVLKATPTVVTPTGVAGLRFLDEPTAINSYVPELKAMGVHAIVVTIHQGGFQTSYPGPTRPTATLTSGPDILDIINRLDEEIDVVISGHSHAFTNAFVPNAAGKQILVTQAFAASTAYSDIDLLIDPATGDVTSKSAQIVTTFGDVGPGLTPDPMVSALVAEANTRIAPLVNEVVGSTTTALTRTQNAAGESTLGNLIADAQRSVMTTQMAFMNPGGIRADLNAGDITWGELFTIQPFGNSMVRMNLTGAQIYAVLEQQWLGQSSPRIMQISGFAYTWNPALPVGSRVVEVRLGGVAIDQTATYSVTCNNFMAAGGDGFTTFTLGTDRIGGPIDLDALIDYIEAQSPVTVAIDGRISLL